MNKLLSLCIPTYGVSEWLFPVLDSIYNQKVDESLYEVVVTDNGNNKEFEKRITEYCNIHNNLIYKKTDVYAFLNEIESYKLASGDFIKFINHRTILLDGALQYLVDFVKNNLNEKPFVYFSNGVLKKRKKLELNTFDSFVNMLSFWSSWSTGMAFWKEDFQNVRDMNITSFNELFPHTNILFSQRNKLKYVIDDNNLLQEIKLDDTKKGKYDLFYAFAVEYPAILLDLLRTNDISIGTFNKVKNDNLSFISRLYFNFVLRKKACSYDISSYNEAINVFYSKKVVRRRVLKLIFKKILKK